MAVNTTTYIPELERQNRELRTGLLALYALINGGELGMQELHGFGSQCRAFTKENVQHIVNLAWERAKGRGEFNTEYPQL